MGFEIRSKNWFRRQGLPSTFRTSRSEGILVWSHLFCVNSFVGLRIKRLVTGGFFLQWSSLHLCGELHGTTSWTSWTEGLLLVSHVLRLVGSGLFTGVTVG